MKNLTKTLIISTFTLVIAACSTTKPTVLTGEYEMGSCQFAGSSEIMPDWMCAPEGMFPEGSVYKRGIANASITDPQTQITIAVENAKADLAADTYSEAQKRFEQTVTTSGLSKSQQQEIDRTITVVTNASLKLPPVVRVNQKHNAQGDLYVLIKVDKKALEKKIKEQEDMLMREFNVQLKNQQLQLTSSDSNS